ncbi:hypothetical protein Y032_0039g136 [Ancylostoma ceylanicum]|uniref:Uncharacterized protein n=1 Tax=Ancylostoma ceylanicum TaxID=53326 RepID=A0A016UHV4_9BILA|nr:hypothetical protein Y032_0039g136 [Ancylostoma ceylanicum]
MVGSYEQSNERKLGSPFSQYTIRNYVAKQQQIAASRIVETGDRSADPYGCSGRGAVPVQLEWKQTGTVFIYPSFAAVLLWQVEDTLQNGSKGENMTAKMNSEVNLMNQNDDLVFDFIQQG